MNNHEADPGSSLRAAAAARLTEAALAAVARVPLIAMRSRLRGGRRVALARQMAMYLAHVGFGLNLTRVGISFGRDRTTVRHACALIEDRRDDVRLECGLNALEVALLAMMNRLEGQVGEARQW